ncbi:MAG: HlyD family efflux transporter periplasmic adaptor subunit [Luteitalea sp.]|nr:HlyD family efflux transporter periplasmic adaptor subunit [Luteitalea sp.]
MSAAVEAACAAVGLARAERERTATALARAHASLRRQETLEEAGAISRDDLEAAQTLVRLSEDGLHAADFNIARAEQDLQIARARLQQPQAGGRPVEIVSPIDGIALKRLRESESVVAAGEPLLEVGNLGDLEVVADLLSTDAVRVPPHARVLIEQWGGNHALDGHVRRVEPSGFMKVSALGVEEQRVNVRIDFADPAAAASALGDGYRVEVRIVVSEQPDVLKVPVGSLFRRGEDWAVFVVDDDRVRTQIVEIGQRNAAEAEVSTGLTDRQRIVLYPPDTLVDGARVVGR